MKILSRGGLFVMCLASASGVWATEYSDSQAMEPAAVSTPSVTAVPEAAVPVAGTPVAVATGPVLVPAPQVIVPVAVPVDVHQSQDAVAWTKLVGTIQSVDRNNKALTVQDREGKNVRVVINDRVRLYRGGEEVAFMELEPNDRVALLYDSDRDHENE